MTITFFKKKEVGMLARELCVRVPGKLMVAGEFAVLEPHEPLLVMAVDRYVYGSVVDSARGLMSLANFGLACLKWSFADGAVRVDSVDERVRFVQQALEVSLRYVVEQGADVVPFHLAIRSELDDGAGKKYGLGSSAAVSVTVVALVLRRFLGKADPYLVFQLASIAHVMVQGNGSGADIAASAYGGVLKYTSFRADWLLDVIAKSASIGEMVRCDWMYASIEEVSFPESVHVYVGWTGSPASTGNLVRDILRLKETDLPAFSTFLRGSREAVMLCARAMKANDVAGFLQGIRQNRAALTALGVAARVQIDTPLLDTLSDIAESLGGAGKFSGAGGGDCGLAFMPESSVVDTLYERWRAAGIEPLSLTLDVDGLFFTS